MADQSSYRFVARDDGTVQAALDPRTKDASDLHVRELRLRAVREAAREVDFVASTEAIDSYGEIVKQNWDLARFKSNPVILWSHNARDLPIGHATKVAVVRNQLEVTIKFATEKANPQAELVWQSVLEQTLRAVSVGFYPREIRCERIDGVDVVILDDNELREISVVTIPANHEALAKAKSAALAKFKQATKSAEAEDHTLAREERGGDSAGTAGRESDMDEKQKAALEMKVAEHEKAIKDLETKAAAETARADKAEAECKALSAQTERLAQERDALAKSVADLDEKLIEIEVGGLVGKKISAAEKADFVELRKSNKALFERMVAQRTDVSYLGAQVISSDGNGEAPAAVDSGEASQSDWERVEKLAKSSNAA